MVKPPRRHPEPPPQTYQPPPLNGYGTAALTLGIIGAGLGLIPIMFWAAFGCGIAGLTLGVTNLRGRIRRGEATNTRTTIAGTVLSIIAVALAITGIAIIINGLNNLKIG